MALYRFRVSFEEYDDIHRDIDIRSLQTFLDFHLAIQKAIGFDASKPASFFMSNDNWKKGQEIHSNATTDKQGVLAMDASRLCDFIADPHQKIYYAFDQPSQWTFFIELIRILPDGEKGKEYPACVKSAGDAPKQYVQIDAGKGVPDPEFGAASIFSDLLMDGEDEPTEDDLESEEGEEEQEDDDNLGDGVDEEEYDDIEEASEDDTERE